MVWDSHIFKSFPQFAFHTVKDFTVVIEAEVDIFLEFSCFFYDPTDVGILTLIPLPFLNPTWTSGSLVHTMLKHSMQNFKHDLTSDSLQ